MYSNNSNVVAIDVTNRQGPLPTKTHARMLYQEHFNIDATAATPASYVFSANGLYDPNYTGVGHQPRGFDQLCTFYDHYHVKKLRATLWACNTNSGDELMVAMYVHDTNTALSSIQDIMEKRNTICAPIPRLVGNMKEPLVLDVDVDRFLGGRDLSERKGSSGSNPTEQAWLVVACWDMNYSHDPSAGFFHLVLDYDTEWMEPKQPSGS